MNHLKIFIELTMINKPIGFMLLFWPCSWGLAYANNFKQNTSALIYYLILFFVGSVLMAVYVGFVRPGGLENTWAFFNLIFLQNAAAFVFAIWSHKKGNLGTNEKTSIEGIIAPGVLTLLSAILCYGLSDKIYI